MKDGLIEKHLHFIVFLGFHFAADGVFVGFAGFHFYEGRHIPLHIVETALQSERFADIRRFEHCICLVEFISGGMKGIIHRLTDMLKVQFAVVKELTFFLPVPQIGAGCQFDRITPEGFLHTSPVIDIFFVLCMNPFIQEKVGYISQ